MRVVILKRFLRFSLMYPRDPLARFISELIVAPFLSKIIGLLSLKLVLGSLMSGFRLFKYRKLCGLLLSKITKRDVNGIFVSVRRRGSIELKIHNLLESLARWLRNVGLWLASIFNHR